MQIPIRHIHQLFLFVCVAVKVNSKDIGEEEPDYEYPDSIIDTDYIAMDYNNQDVHKTK